MLQNIKQLYGKQLAASDGEIGRVKDFYFDDQSWAIRYVIADTGSWLPGRQVLLSPHVFGEFHTGEKFLRIGLTREQIEKSPPIASHKPVSRQYEEEYHRYFGWPCYWQGNTLLELSGETVSKEIATPVSGEKTGSGNPPSARTDAHLRSTRAVTGYHLRAGEETIGHVCGFIVDESGWTIHHLLIKIGHRLTGKEVEIPAGKVERISYEESTVFVNLTREAIEQNPPHRLSTVGVAD